MEKQPRFTLSGQEMMNCLGVLRCAFMKCVPEANVSYVLQVLTVEWRYNHVKHATTIAEA